MVLGPAGSGGVGCVHHSIGMMLLFFQEKKLEVTTIPFREAAEYVRRHHRHCRPPVGHKFSLACYHEGRLCGVAICGRPVSRHLDDGSTIEVSRLCTDGTRNACSKLYGAACRYARRLGFVRVVTYTLVSENGASLRAANFVLDAENCGGLEWTGRRKHKSTCLKNRWVKILPHG